MAVNFPISFNTNLYQGAKWPFWCIRILDFNGDPIAKTDFVFTSDVKRSDTDITAAKSFADTSGLKVTNEVVLFDAWVDLRGGYLFWVDMRVEVKGSYIGYIRKKQIFVQRSITGGGSVSGSNTTFPGVPVDWRLPILINQSGGVDIQMEDGSGVILENDQQVITES